MDRSSIQVLFNKPVVPLGTLDDPSRKEVLSHFSLTPPVQGAFRLLGTNAVVFEPAHHLTLANEYRVTVKRGIKAVDGSILPTDLSWTFRTPGPHIDYINPNGMDHAVPDQKIFVTSNQALNIISLKDHVRLMEVRSLGREEPIVFDVTTVQDNPREADELGMERHQFRYEIKLRAPLKLDTKYTITVSAGVRGKTGNLTTPAALSAWFKTYGQFRFVRIETQHDNAYNDLKPSYQMVFTNGVSQEEMDKNVVVAEGELAAPGDKLLGFLTKVTKGREARKVRAAAQGSLFSAYQRETVAINNAALTPDTDYELSLQKDLTDIYGQKLANPGDTGFRSGNLQPAIVARQGMYVISKKVNPILPVGVQSIEKLYSKILGIEDPKDLLGNGDLEYNISSRVDQFEGEYTATLGAPEKNKAVRHEVDLKQWFNADGFGAVLYNFYAPEEARRFNYHRDDDVHHAGLIFRTDLGVHFKTHRKKACLW